MGIFSDIGKIADDVAHVASNLEVLVNEFETAFTDIEQQEAIQTNVLHKSNGKSIAQNVGDLLQPLLKAMQTILHNLNSEAEKILHDHKK